MAVQDVHAPAAQHPRSPQDRPVECPAAQRKRIDRDARLASALRERGARVRHEAHPVATPAQLGDNQERPVDLPRPGPLAVDVYDVHGPGPPQR